LDNASGLPHDVLPEMVETKSLTESFSSKLKKFYGDKTFTLENFKLLAREYSIEEEEVFKIDQAISSIVELYVLFGMESPRTDGWLRTHKKIMLSHKDQYLRIIRSNHARYKTMHRFLCFVSLNGEGSWVKILKWKFASLFAFYRDQDQPAVPEMNFQVKNRKYIHSEKDGLMKFLQPQQLLGGVAHEFLVNLRRLNFDRFMQFIDTTQQLKKSMPDVPNSLVLKAVEETAEKLTTEPSQVPDQRVEFIHKVHAPFNWMNIEDRIETFDISVEDIKLELRRTVREIFGDKQFTYKMFIEPFFPSTSANYIWSRTKGGSVSDMYEKQNLGKRGDDLVQFGEEFVEFSGKIPKYYGERGAHELNEINKMEEAGFEQPCLGPVLLADTTLLEAEWEKVIWEVYEQAKTEEPCVLPVGLPEPLKVRVISKGPPQLYTVLKTSQKHLWSVLKAEQVFALIGRYVEPADIDRILGQLQADEQGVSGDYVASTNEIYSWVSETILDELMICEGENMSLDDMQKFPKDFMIWKRAMMLKSLTRHIFVKMVPSGVFNKYGKEIMLQEKRVQKNGQLMGSITSFPFLCIANATVCRMALERANLTVYRLINRPFPGSGPIAPLGVNGDDCLLRGKTGRIRPLWESICSIAGLKSSMGKTYFSNTFCTINSTIFQFDGVSWKERKYVNLGLMMGRKRQGKGDKSSYEPQVGIHQLGVICRELKRSCPEDLWPAVKRRFIYYNANALKQYPNIPWFVPEWLGGVGLPVDDEKEISKLDRIVATVIKVHMNSDRKYMPVKPKDACEWNMHQLVQRDLKPLSFYMGEPLFKYCHRKGEVHTLEDEYSRLYKLMTINLLMKLPFAKLQVALEEMKSVEKALWHNNDVWVKSRNLLSKLNLFDYEPMTDSDMLHENKKLVLPVIVTPFSTDYKIWMGDELGY